MAAIVRSLSKHRGRGAAAALGGAARARRHGTAAMVRAAERVEGASSSAAAAPGGLRREPPAPFTSTVRSRAPLADFSSVSLKRDDGDYYFETHSEALFSALNSRADGWQWDKAEVPSPRRVPAAAAREMDLVEASRAARDADSYDKVLILMRHGEAAHNQFERDYAAREDGRSVEEANADANYPVDPLLTGKGCGQMLDLSRRTATFFNDDTGLRPELFVVSPLRRAIQSAIIAFPTHTAVSSLTGTPWICHPSVMEGANGNKSEYVSSPSTMEGTFPGVDFGLLRDALGGGDVVDALNGRERVPLFESKIDLMGRTDEFLTWVKERPERVIVVSSHATWLQSFCAFTLQYDPESNGLEMFKKGEMRSIGIKFD